MASSLCFCAHVNLSYDHMEYYTVYICTLIYYINHITAMVHERHGVPNDRQLTHHNCFFSTVCDDMKETIKVRFIVPLWA